MDKRFLNAIINIRGIVSLMPNCGYGNLSQININSWQGNCQEIYDALSGDKDHYVEIIKNKYCIWRNPAIGIPTFIQLSSNKFLSPYWRKK